ncbi:MAG: FmdB family zinc ribbon protein [Chloroflexota bacterium]
MPSYTFHCNSCHRDLTLFYKTYRQYDDATHTCPHCQSTDLTRTITSVTIGRGSSSHDYTAMNANQMLSVFESGDSKAVGEMMKQVGATVPDSNLGENYNAAADKLSSGASMDSVERDLRNNALGKASDAPLPDLRPGKKP